MNAVLVFSLLAAAVSLRPVTLAPSDTGVGVVARAIDVSPVRGAGFRPVVGVVDTVGGTTYDWQLGGPANAMLACSPSQGIHTAWIYSAQLTGTTYPDRNIRYNYYDFASHAWNWIDTNYMQSGMNVFDGRSGYGNLCADPRNGVAIIGRHGGTPIHPSVARDISAGAGLFEYAEGTPAADNLQWPQTAVTADGTIHQFAMTATYLLGYTRVLTWPTYEQAVNGFDPGTTFLSHNLAASKVSQKVFTCWTDNASPVERAYWRSSEDGGATWGAGTELVAPHAFSGDTVTSYHITSLYPFYDREDRLHVVSNFLPVVHDTGYIIPAEIWHWTDGVWTRIHRAGCAPEHLAAGVGYDAMYACRPTIGEDAHQRLYVAWEQFDSANVEPVTDFMRADVFMAASEDNGQTWLPPVKITEAGTTSCRFPSVVDLAWPGDPDTVAVHYLVDVMAGFSVQGEHPNMNNPMVVQKVPVTALGAGIEEGRGGKPCTSGLSASPNPFRDRLQVGLALARSGAAEAAVFDAAGRRVRTLCSGFRAVGTHTFVWDGRTEGGAEAPAGVYVARLTSSGCRASVRVIKAE